ncbi:hypothetical protein LXL04_003398 [Taraxacum kok-saghyz]
MAKMELNPNNSAVDKKHIYDTVKWWIYVRNILLGEIEHVVGRRTGAAIMYTLLGWAFSPDLELLSCTHNPVDTPEEAAIFRKFNLRRLTITWTRYTRRRKKLCFIRLLR